MDLDGMCWSLKGINGRPVPLGGCVRDAEIRISGRRFDHHVFVSREGTGKQEIILGQPWLQWYSASIQYTRQGSMNMWIWQEGDGDKHGCHQSPSILILLAHRMLLATRLRLTWEIIRESRKSWMKIQENKGGCVSRAWT